MATSPKKETVINVRVTQEERDAFNQLSVDLLGKRSASRLLRKLVREALHLGPDLINEERKDFQHALRQLTGIARNLNQITASINSGNHASIERLTVAYLSRLSDEVSTLKQAMIQFINNTKQRSMKVLEVE